MIDSFIPVFDNLALLINDKEDYWQWGTIALSFIGATIIFIILRKTLFSHNSTYQTFLRRFFNPGKKIGAVPIYFSLILWISWAARNRVGIPCGYIHSAALLVTAFVIYQIATAVSKGRSVPKFLGGGMLLVFTLHIFGWLKPISEVLRSIHVPLGSVDIQLWAILSTIVALIILFWLVGLSTHFIDAAVKPRTDIPPSIKVLIGKTARLLLYLIAIVAALKIGGVPLGGLAVFSGALGLGIGFGLQKVISNLVSGVIILLDKSIKPGDVIEIEGTFGWINSLRTRYVSVITRDRKEILIPNEDFVTNKVINWSFTDRIVRIKANVGVSYDTDLPLAIKLCTEAASGIKRVLTSPAPTCLLTGFGDSSVDLQIRFWIDDAPQGVSNIRSEVYLAVWQTFRDNNIEIPFPQRDLHIKSDNRPLTANS